VDNAVAIALEIVACGRSCFWVASPLAVERLARPLCQDSACCAGCAVRHVSLCGRQ
jgi:hypothetical protein